MSVISKNRETQREVRDTLYKLIQRGNIEERDLMNEMLDLLRQTETPLTAAQIAEALEFKISIPEVAGNLTVMAHRPDASRYWSIYQHVNIPDRNSHEKITRKIEHRRATVIEIDKDGNRIGLPRQILLHGATKYKIDEI